MKRLLWILHHLREIWNWAGIYTQVLSYGVKDKDVNLALSDHVEFDIPGMIAPYDRMRLVAGRFTSCGTARMGMSLDIYEEKWGGWCGGVIDHKDLAEIRDLITIHLGLIDDLPPDEKFRLQQIPSEQRRLKKEPISTADSWPDELDGPDQKL